MRHDHRGFTLLEAIVALAILAAGGMALFAALNASLRSIERIDAAARLDTATRNAIAHLETVNPMRQPEGETLLGEVRMRWVATPIEARREGLTDYLQPGYFDIALYRVEVELETAGEAPRRFELRRAGWEQVRKPVVL